MLTMKEVWIVVGLMVLIVGFYCFFNYYVIMEFDGVTIPRVVYNALNEKFNGNFMICDADVKNITTTTIECLYFSDGKYISKRIA